MKRINMWVALGAALLLATTAFGQSTPGTEPGAGQNSQPGRGQWGGRGMSPEARLERLSRQLKLTDDQKAKIQPILADENKKMQELRADTSASREDRWSKVQAIRQNTFELIRPVLNADQQKQLDAMSKNGGQRRSPGGRGNRPGGMPPDAGGAPPSQPPQ